MEPTEGYFIWEVNQALARGDSCLARALAERGAEVYPENEDLEKLARALRPREVENSEETMLDVHTALNRIECGMGGVREASVLREMLGEMDVLARGAMAALDARDMIHARQWVGRIERVLDKAQNRISDSDPARNK